MAAGGCDAPGLAGQSAAGPAAAGGADPPDRERSHQPTPVPLVRQRTARAADEASRVARGMFRSSRVFSYVCEPRARAVARPHGDVCKLKIDAIVNSTNESLNEINGQSERIMATAGHELVLETLELEGCRTGEAKMTSGFNLPARYHTWPASSVRGGRGAVH